MSKSVEKLISEDLSKLSPAEMTKVYKLVRGLISGVEKPKPLSREKEELLTLIIQLENMSKMFQYDLDWAVKYEWENVDPGDEALFTHPERPRRGVVKNWIKLFGECREALVKINSHRLDEE